jgi:serine/threonine-protein kinase
LEGARQELQRILNSPAFADSPRLCALLTFLVDETVCGRAGELKESVIAVEVFDRPTAFDHRTDSVVRVQVHNLRGKLRAFYEADGQEHPIRIELPQGSYVPVFQSNEPVVVVPETIPQSPRFSVRSKLLAAAVVILACGLGWWFWGGRLTLRWPRANPSLAVLPFLNLTGGADSEYVADGFVEDLTTQLARLPGLRVAARTSAYQYRGKSEDVRKIGRELGVATVLEGSIRNEGAKLRVTAQLVSTQNGYHLWSNIYDRELTGVQDVESEIQRAVAEALKVPRMSRPGPRHVAPADARDAYWRGRYIRADFRRTHESISWFEKAAAIDPRFAEDWAALASAHAMTMYWAEGPLEEEVAKSRQAAQRALDLDSTIPEAFLTLALLALYHDHDWPESERMYRRALDLDPNYSGAHLNYSLGLVAYKRFDEAMEQLKLAQQLDPILVLKSNNLVVALYGARRYDEAIRVARQRLEMDPKLFAAHEVIGICEAQKGNLATAIGEYEKAVAQGGRYLPLLGNMGYALARAGRVAEARSILSELLARQDRTGGASVDLACVYTGLGEKQQAISWLRRAADEHASHVIFIGVNPIFDPLRGEPEFQALCTRLGLPAGH